MHLLPNLWNKCAVFGIFEYHIRTLDVMMRERKLGVANVCIELVSP